MALIDLFKLIFKKKVEVVAKLTNDEMRELLSLGKEKLAKVEEKISVSEVEITKEIDKEISALETRQEGVEESRREELERELEESRKRHNEKITSLKIQRANAVNKAKEENAAELSRAQSTVKKLEDGMASLDNQTKVQT